MSAEVSAPSCDGSGKPARKFWQCKACASVVYGINWRLCMQMKQFHRTPTGGECRAVNFDLLGTEAPEGSTPVEAMNNT